MLCYGGSFNPIHAGHLICARAAAEAAGFDRVVLFPSPQPPHKKEDTTLAAAEHRLAMCRLAVQNEPLFEVSDFEFQQPGPSYTIETARRLKANGWSSVDWLIGGDMFKTLPNWHLPLELLAEVQFWILARPGWSFDWKAMPPEYAALREKVVIAPLVEISSTDIRRRVAASNSIAYLTPPPVVGYIQEHRLYR